MRTKLNAKNFRRLIKIFESFFPDPYIPTWVFSNHDFIRHISRFKEQNAIEKAKLNTALQLTVRGVPTIYYGEEIGMRYYLLPFDESLDAVSYKFKKTPRLIQNILLKLTDYALNRDGCRTPMQWNKGETAGFSPNPTDTWLPVNQNYKSINVESSLEDKDSLYFCYQRFLKLRKITPALNSGNITLLDPKTTPKDILGYTRSVIVDGNDQKVYVYLNFGSKIASFHNPVPNSHLLTSTTISSQPLDGQNITLQPF